MNSLLKNFSLLVLLFGLTCGGGIPTAMKFEESNLKPGSNSDNATVRIHHIAFDNTILSFKAKASPSDVLFTIVIKVTEYDCANINDDNICSDHLGCSYDFERTIAVSDDAEIIWQTQTVGDYGEMVWQDAPANITYCGEDIDNKPFADATKNVYFSYNGNKDFTIHIQKASIYIISISLFANHDQIGIEQFSLSYTLGVANGLGYLSLVDNHRLCIFCTLIVMYILIGLLWMIVLAISYKNSFKIQLWILLVIILALMEKAIFAGMYTAVNWAGVNIEGHPLYVTAELISSAKNLLAKLLLVASFGYGTTVKPSLDTQMNRVVPIGVIYGAFSILDGITHAYGLCDNTEYFTTIPLVIIDIIILYWIITSNGDTRPIPKVQHNDTKPIRYNRMIYTFSFLMIVGITCRLWSIIYTRLSLCLPWWSVYLYDCLLQYHLYTTILYIMQLWKPSRDPETLFFYPVVYGKDSFEECKLGNFGDTKVDIDLKGALTEEIDDMKLPKENLHKSALDILLKHII